MTVKIKDIATVVSGGTPSTDEDGNFGGHIVWITPKDLSLNVGSKYIFTGERNITKQGFENCSAQMIPANNILITTRAPIGYIAINQIECCTNQGFKSLICDTAKVDVDFLYYYLHTQVPWLEKMGTGTTFKEISKSAIEDFEIDLPSLTKQKKIASLLSQIDEQIQRNNDMVHKLQVLIQTTYSVVFEEYLNRTTIFNAELKREIPVGWTVKALMDFITLQNGISYSEKDLNSGINMINLNSFNLDGSYKVDGIKKYGGKYNKENTLKPYDLLISKTDVTRNRDIICKSILVPDYYDCDVVYSSDIAKIECKSISKYYLNLLFNSNSFHNYIKHFANGTVVLHLIVDGMLNFKIPIPNDNTFCEFDDKVEPLFKQINALVKENIELSKLKEKLSPLLINGQLLSV